MSDVKLLMKATLQPEATFSDFFAHRMAVCDGLERPKKTDRQIIEEGKRARYISDGEFYLDNCVTSTGVVIHDGITAEDNLVEAWHDFGTKTQDAYEEYHTAGMLVAIGHLFPATMKPQYALRGIHNNMWCIILGNSGCGKSMACGAVNTLLNDKRISPYVNRLTNKFTPEAFTIALSENSRRLHYSNEAAGFLKFMKRDYAAELSDDLTNAYDCERVSKNTIRLGVQECTNPLYSGLWNTTIDAWGKYATSDQFASGAFLRPFYIISTRKKDLMRDKEIDKETLVLHDKIVERIQELLVLVHGEPTEDGFFPKSRKIVFRENQIINDWKHELREQTQSDDYSELEKSTVQRVFDQARKLAMNLTIASTWFLDYVKTYPVYTGDLPTEENTTIVCEIPDKFAMLACEVAEDTFWKNSIKAATLTFGNGSPGAKRVMDALQDGKKHTKTEIGDIVGFSGHKLDDMLVNLPLKSAIIKVPESKRPIWVYWLNV
jgi:energy-coupling factor transporter ATP-binding protein EcfA2